MKKHSVEEIAKTICAGMGYDINKPAHYDPNKKLWELWVKPARAVHELIYGGKQS